MRIQHTVLPLLVLAGLLMQASARATIIAAPSVVTSSGSLALSAETLASGTSGSGVNFDLLLPGSYIYGRSFAEGGTVLAADNSLSFIDSYAFTVTESGGSAVNTAIAIGNLQGISNLDTRIYQADVGDSIPLLGLPPSFGSSQGYYTAVNTQVALGGFGVLRTSAVDPVFLNAGTYVLEVRGLVSGSLGGSYSGALSLLPKEVLPPAPVPIAGPGISTFMMLSGGLIAWTRRRRPAAR